jgi:hypothetical protein
MYSLRSLYDVDAVKNTWIFHPLQQTFTLEGKKIEVTMTPVPLGATPNGMCGAVMNADVTLAVDGKIILNHCALILHQCGQSDEAYRQKRAQAKCADGLYYAITDDLLVGKDGGEIAKD